MLIKPGVVYLTLVAISTVSAINIGCSPRRFVVESLRSLPAGSVPLELASHKSSNRHSTERP
jgi:hypothetical protein